MSLYWWPIVIGLAFLSWWAAVTLDEHYTAVLLAIYGFPT